MGPGIYLCTPGRSGLVVPGWVCPDLTAILTRLSELLAGLNPGSLWPCCLNLSFPNFLLFSLPRVLPTDYYASCNSCRPCTSHYPTSNRVKVHLWWPLRNTQHCFPESKYLREGWTPRHYPLRVEVGDQAEREIWYQSPDLRPYWLPCFP